jgi:hypothetical protein
MKSLLLIFNLIFSVYYGYKSIIKTPKLLFKVKMSSSVSGGSIPQPKQNAKTFSISPTSLYAEEEMFIIENFNEIQLGEIKKIGIFGTQELSENHKQMIELLSYALVLSGNHVFTSGGGSGTNLAVIRGALRACNPDLLTVILPQSLFRQPAEMQILLARVSNLIQQSQNDDLDLKEAANLCNLKILSSVDKVLVFAYHESKTILNAIDDYQKNETAIEIIKFYLD